MQGRDHGLSQGRSGLGADGGYFPPDYQVSDLDLTIELGMTIRVRSLLRFERRQGGRVPFRLDGVGLALLGLELDGEPLPATAYHLDDAGLTILRPPPQGCLSCAVEIAPQDGGTEGLLRLGHALVTNCEPEGFRRITFFPDRPDVAARMTTTLIGDRKLHPVLLSNGIREASGDAEGGRHFVRWRDPWPKSAYLFALAAGPFVRVEEDHLTPSGRLVRLAVNSSPEAIAQCHHGLQAAKRAIDWDERTYGLRYDLEELNLVVLDSFPGGAMECKGLNLYSSEFFLGSPEVSTDDELRRIEAVVAHEYLHNWTGNRVGCREWRELAVKESLTVFREQQFVESLDGSGETRIRQVARLRETQFGEDDGELAHPVRPTSAPSPNNLYTRTVYEKGAEIFRMLQLLVGADAFRAGLVGFLRDFDGRAAGLDDLIDRIEAESGVDLRQFRAWFETAGRPVVKVTIRRVASTGLLHLTLEQSLPRAPDSPPLHIPIRIGWAGDRPDDERLIHFRTRSLELELPADERTVPAILRGFSAPVDCDLELGAAELQTLALRERDSFLRWEAMQALARRAAQGELAARLAWTEAAAALLEDPELGEGLKGSLLLLPTEAEIGRGTPLIDVEGIMEGRRRVAVAASVSLGPVLPQTYFALQAQARQPMGSGARLLRRACLSLQIESDAAAADICRTVLASAGPMEERATALRLLIDFDEESRAHAIGTSYEAFGSLPFGLRHWFAAQASARGPVATDLVRSILGHPAFDPGQAPLVKAVFDTFCANQSGFHDGTGEGYRLVADAVLLLDPINSRLATRFFRHLGNSERVDDRRQGMMRREIGRIEGAANLSSDLSHLVAEARAGSERKRRSR